MTKIKVLCIIREFSNERFSKGGERQAIPSLPSPGSAVSNMIKKDKKPPHLRVKWIVNPDL